MKNAIILIMLIIGTLHFSRIAFGQTGYYVSKDYRIKKHQKSIVEFLIVNKQFTINKTPFQVRNYEGKMFVSKEIELFHQNILVVRFGSLGDHADQYWGVLTKDTYILMDIEKEADKKRLSVFLNDYDLQTKTTICTYIKNNSE